MTRPLAIEEGLVERFSRDLGVLVVPGERLGLAVSGGPDSLALLLLAHGARAGEFDVATVDHGLRRESAAEAALVASLCETLGVAHTTLRIDWPEHPTSGTQEKARKARYRALARWAGERSFGTVLTGHHRDDQAETLAMRLARGAGVRGLAAMRPSAAVPGCPSLRLVRPLLDWSRDELRAVCASAGVTPVQDASNEDERFERVRIRAALASSEWLDAAALARSAANLDRADEALDWAAEREWSECVTSAGGGLAYRPAAPAEIRRRVVARIITNLATEGVAELRGAELDRLLETLETNGTATLRGVRCSGGHPWVFRTAARRRG